MARGPQCCSTYVESQEPVNVTAMWYHNWEILISWSLSGILENLVVNYVKFIDCNRIVFSSFSCYI